MMIRQTLSIQALIDLHTRDNVLLFEQCSITADKPIYDVKLSQVTFRDCILHNVTLPRANFEGAVFERTTIELAVLQQANLSHVLCIDTIMDGIDLSESTLEGAVFRRCSLQATNLQYTNLRHAQMRQSLFQNAIAQHADLTSANIQGANLQGADFRLIHSEGINSEHLITDIHTRWHPLPPPKSPRKQAGANQPPLLGLSVPLSQSVSTQGSQTITLPQHGIMITLEIARKSVQKMLAPLFQRTGRARQAKFRVALFQAYNGRCAVTECAVEGALEAAHIIPYCLDKANQTIANGILLRSDLHRLFDLHQLCIDPQTGEAHFNAVLLDTDPSYQLFEGRVIAPPRDALFAKTSPYEKQWRENLKWRNTHYPLTLQGFFW